MDWSDVFLGSGIRTTIPILLATLGCLPTLWTRDINIGLEGIMIFGAFAGVALGLVTQSVLLAVVLTVAVAGVAGLAFGVLVSKLKVDVFVLGLVLFVFAGAAVAYLLDGIFGVEANLSDPAIPGLPALVIPGIADVPVLGGLLSGHSPLTWLCVLLVALVVVADRRSVVVRRLRAAGSAPTALAASGVAVDRLRILAQVWCFVLSALAGVQISLGQLSLFTLGMTGGVGFVALAAAIFSGGRVWLAVLVSLGLGFATSVTYQFDKNVVPFELTQMIPYLAALAALIVLSRRGGLSRPATPYSGRRRAASAPVPAPSTPTNGG